jgi:hypothetical protein
MNATILLILALCGPIDRERFLHALALVESNDNPKAVGKAGEVGRHQISKIAFRELARLGLSGTGDPAHRLIDIKLTLMRKAGVADSAANVALCWHHGFTGAKRRKWKPDSHAQRTANIYNLSASYNQYSR